MMTTLFSDSSSRRSPSGFTLIELLVVIAIIALLIGILLPALGSARRTAQAIATAANQRAIGQGVAAYNVDNKDLIPPSYVYGNNPRGYGWDIDDQIDSNPEPDNGYIHWSKFLFEGDDTSENAFEGPAVTNKGAPRTNPGPGEDNWEPGQVNDKGDGFSDTTNQPQDRQAARVAFTANGAIMPRNKLADVSLLGGGAVRKYRLVKASEIFNSSQTILAAEFFDGKNEWRSISTATPTGDGGADPNGGSFVVKSHRPITPFVSRSSGEGGDVLEEPIRNSPPPNGTFFYQAINDLIDRDENKPGNQINGGLNMVGQPFEGKGNFLFVDGHSEKLTTKDTIRKRLWGERFYAITGDNRVNQKIDANGQNLDDE